jgi:glycosyltransferase involved in cell wall biosynthesis
MKIPLVSVIIPLYNHERFVKKAIQSVLNQSFSDLELIVINDGSKDRSEAIVKTFRDPRIRYFSQPNRGAHHALNRGVRLARGKYVSILNSDDIYHQQRLELCIKKCEANSAIGACFSHISIINNRGLVRGAINGSQNNETVLQHRMTLRGRRDIVLNLLGGNFLATTSNLFCSRKVLLKAGPFKPFRYAHDFDCFLRLCFETQVHIIPKQLLQYRVHRHNTISEDKASTYFEHALILTRLFSSNSLLPVFCEKRSLYDTMTRFFNSLETFSADKIILVMLLFLLYGKHSIARLERDLLSNPHNPFRKRCIAFLNNLNAGGSPKERIAAAVRRLNKKTDSNCAVYLFGTGEFSRIVYRHLQKHRIKPMGYFDNNPDTVNQTKNNLPIEAPRFIPGIKVIIASSARHPIYQQLRRLGFPCKDIIVLK